MLEPVDTQQQPPEQDGDRLEAGLAFVDLVPESIPVDLNHRRDPRLGQVVAPEVPQ